MERKRGIDWLVLLLGVITLILALVWMVMARQLSPTGHTLGLTAFMLAFVAVAIVDNIRRDRRLDEVELAAARFGTRWAVVASIILAGIAFLPPVQSLLVGLEAQLADSGNARLPTAVKIFVFGVSLSIVVQQLVAQALSAIWALAKR